MDVVHGAERGHRSDALSREVEGGRTMPMDCSLNLSVQYLHFWSMVRGGDQACRLDLSSYRQVIRPEGFS